MERGAGGPGLVVPLPPPFSCPLAPRSPHPGPITDPAPTCAPLLPRSAPPAPASPAPLRPARHGTARLGSAPLGRAARGAQCRREQLSPARSRAGTAPPLRAPGGGGEGGPGPACPYRALPAPGRALPAPNPPGWGIRATGDGGGAASLCPPPSTPFRPPPRDVRWDLAGTAPAQRGLKGS